MTHTDLDEGTTARLCCLRCHHDVARIAIATPVVYGDVSLDCAECGEQLVRWRIF